MKYPNIEAERARLGMSKDDLARACGVTYRTLYNWERNGHYRLDAVQKMAKLFNCTIDYLVLKEETK